jgi:hypothetical protein
MSARFGRGLWAITAGSIIFAIYMEVLFWPEATKAGAWMLIGLIAALGFLTWSIGLGILFLLHGR